MAIGLTESELLLFFDLLDKAAKSPLLASDVTRSIAVRFAIDNLGSWTLRVAPGASGAVTADDGDASAAEPVDCTLSCEKSVLLDLANQKRKFAVAFMKGLISVRGDRSVFSSLQPLIKAAAGDFKAQRDTLASPSPSDALRVVVHGSSVVADARETFAVYLIEVFEGDSRWTLARRWSEIRTLARRVGRLRPATGFGPLPTLPRSLDFAGSLEQAFLDKRAILIGTYISAVLLALPTSVLGESGAEPLRLFLAPADLGPSATSHHGLTSPGITSPGLTSPAMMSPPSAGRQTSRTSGMRDSMADVSGFDVGPRMSMTPGGRMVSMEGSLSAGAPTTNSQLGSPLGSPPWTTIHGPMLSPVGGGGANASAHTRRIEDVYTPYSPSVSGVRLDSMGGRDSSDEHPADIGLLVEALLAAAATKPIHAESDKIVLGQRNEVLARLRSLESLKPPTSLLTHARRAAMAGVTLALRVFLPATIGLAAATRGYALPTLLCLGHVTFYVATSTLRMQAAAMLGLSGLVGLYTSQTQSAAGIPMASAANVTAASCLDATSGDATAAAIDAAASAAIDAASNVTDQLCREAGAAGAAGLEHAAAQLPHLVPTLGEMSQALLELASIFGGVILNAPLRSMVAGLGYCAFVLAYVLFGRLGRVYSIGFTVMISYFLMGRASEKLSKRIGWFMRHEEDLWSALHYTIAPYVCGHIVELKSVYVKFGQYALPSKPPLVTHLASPPHHLSLGATWQVPRRAGGHRPSRVGREPQAASGRPPSRPAFAPPPRRAIRDG